MMNSKFCLALLLLGIIYCDADYFNTYDYLELASRWPDTYCLTHEGTCRDKVPQNFTISYIRPKKRGGPDLENCPTAYPLLNSTIEANKNDLLKFWPDLTTDNFQESKAMWNDQWKMYGSCFNMRPDEFIQYALNSRKRSDIKKILARAGIVPNGLQYPPRRILQVFKKALGVNVDIVCEEDRSGNIYLAEVHECVDYYGTTPIDCYNKARGCDDYPIYPNMGFVSPNKDPK
ncbi:ribonuclease S-2-like [Gastrolobium bilobum]|uniref:ribonuclease S-2-like n=1 Tax=Gastrolobium bilobum TaxID=150636 RepID=UPI002AB1B0BE|nr:ribonuclease S-2-like [Gastrolobium bilobum]